MPICAVWGETGSINSDWLKNELGPTFPLLISLSWGVLKRLRTFLTGVAAGSESGETPSVTGNGVPGSATSKKLKAVPEEALPDLIRLVRHLLCIHLAFWGESLS